MTYRWSAGPPDRTVVRIPADKPVWIVSDLHLGDGGRSDSFMGKDRALLALLDRVRETGARLVINGDAIDFMQARSLTPILRAHGRLLRAFSELAASNGVWYLCGNHDDDLHIYRDVLRFEVANELWIGDDIVVEHGHAFDPWIGPNMVDSGGATRFHHWIERTFGTWIRLPLADFYTRGNRLSFWLFHKYAVWLRFRNRALTRLGWTGPVRAAESFLDYWVRNEAGDPMVMFGPALASARARGAHTVVCGHSHMPAHVEHQGIRFVNSGSWTFGWAQYILFENGTFTVKDWLSGREYHEELYRPLLDGDLDHITFERWWRNQYLGWFRFRSGELRRALHGSGR